MTVEERGAVKIARVFDFPRESVFRMWTDPKKVSRWFGSPEGCVTVVSEWDPRPGGAIKTEDITNHVSLTGAFTRVVAPELLVFRGVAKGPGPYFPNETLNTVTLEELGPKRTRITVAVNVVVAPRGVVEALKEGFRGGWGQSLEKLQRAFR